ncbi:hypothetical protein M9978_05005 [Sphingomonas sp. MG17]|uniref:Terminase small subunit n=1 Tax=Sphingomonas tagetis TaxID=2949092 RepID=A0A9X2HM13_9SPHN|nr:hypothetical protein [Sphingomonas tagetis]MCP3729783.1 hypothetical protein [Sphingomonas tagetis]
MKHAQPTTDPLATYTPATLRARHDGWTAERQRTFLSALAETGCISEAAHAAQIAPRSAYRLRNHPQGRAFATAWDKALQLAAARLMTTAYERAIKGSVREMWKDGELVGEIRQPSDKLLIYLLGRIAAVDMNGAGDRWSGIMRWSASASAALDASLAALSDSEVPIDRLSPYTYDAIPLGQGRETLAAPFLATASDDRPRDSR